MPNQLSTKLCRIFDGGYTDIKTFARLCGESPRTIEWLTNRPGAQIDRETEFRVSKLIASFKRMYPELSFDIEPQPKRRVVEQETHRLDERTFALYNSAGKWCGTWTCPSDDVDAEMFTEINRYIDKKDEIKNRLRLMRDGA